MKYSNAHNASRPLDVERPYGIRVSIRGTDTFARVIGKDWSREHWFATKSERDRVMQDMASRHLYSRRGDSPTLIYKAIER